MDAVAAQGIEQGGDKDCEELWTRFSFGPEHDAPRREVSEIRRVEGLSGPPLGAP
jgi:hypothetical protein